MIDEIIESLESMAETMRAMGDDDQASGVDSALWLIEEMMNRSDRKTEPQTCEECEHWNDTEDGCADRHGCKDEPQTDATDINDGKKYGKKYGMSSLHCVDCTHYGDYEICIKCDDNYSRYKSYYEPKDEPQTDYDKGLQLFADILFDKEKSEQFLKECKAMGIEP